MSTRALAVLLTVSACAVASSSASAAEPGSLNLEKKVTVGDGPDAGIFSFSGSWGESFTLSAGSSRSISLLPGEYSFSEQPEPGYDFLGITCSTPSGQASFSSPVATFRVESLRETSCVSTSKPQIDIDVDPDVTGNARLRYKRSCRSPHRMVVWVTAGNARWVSFRAGYKWVATVRRPIKGRLFRTVIRVGSGAVPISAKVRLVAGATPPEIRLSRVASSCLRSPAYAGAHR